MIEITSQHPDYAKRVEDWKLIYDISETGERGVKAKKETYLPFPIPLDADVIETTEFANAYELYLCGAYLINFTEQAVSDLINSVFTREIIHDELPTELEYLDLNQISKNCLKEAAAYGRAFLLMDYPNISAVPTIKAEKDKNIQAYSTVYSALDVINWRTESSGGIEKIIRIVLVEKVVNEQNEEETRHRELILVDGVYTVRLHSDFDLIDEYIPLADGKTLDHIPGIFIGVVSNTSLIDQPPVLGIANTNIKHYQTTAELQHAIVYQGHPMLGITGAPLGFVAAMNANKTKVSIGASNAIVVEGESGNIQILEINPNLTHYKHLEELKKSIAEQGGRIKTIEKAGIESAEALRIRASASNSTLASIAIQVENAVKFAVQEIALFMGVTVDEDFAVNLNKDFILDIADHNLINALSSLNNQGKIPLRILYDYLSSVRLVEESEDYVTLASEAQQEIEMFAIDNAESNEADT